MSSDNVLLQNLRDFTVQIRHTMKNTIVGTGIVISMDGKILTCAHVVVAAGVNPQIGRSIPGSWTMIVESIFGRKAEVLSDARDAEVEVYFPARSGRGGETRRARVLACFSSYEDDVVVLQLVGGSVPLGPEQIARLGIAEPSEGNHFRSYGYTPTGSQPATRTDGQILGTVERSPDSHLQADLVQLRSRDIDAGMSGAAVLDVVRNLVVGLIVERYYPGTSLVKDDIAYAVDNYVLTFDPLNLPVQDVPLPLRTAPQPKTDIGAALEAAVFAPGIALNGAPPPLPEWVGRKDLLQAISADWADHRNHVTGLIGFGGEGKSSLARRWLDTLLEDAPQSQPDGIFWWNFYDKPNVDTFFEAALAYMSGERIDPRRLPSTIVQAQVIGAMLGARRYLFILDGLEVMQHQKGDQYGLLTSTDLREFVSYFAASGHNSFCLITSRSPMLDLLDYTTYTHRDVDRLSPADGHALLRQLGVKGSDEAVDQVVEDWNGHALALSLLGSYLVERYGGDVAHIVDIPPPTENESGFAYVQQVLRRYDAHLTQTERAFLMLFSAFRLPLAETAFLLVFRAWTQGIEPKKKQRLRGSKRQGGQAVATEPSNILNAPIAALNDTAFKALLERLVAYRILRYDSHTGHYTVHPLIRSHYLARFNECDRNQVKAAHERIKDYYLFLARDISSSPTLNNLIPLLEAVHHACCAETHTEAWNIFRKRISQDDRAILIHELGAYQTQLATLLEFFPHGNTSQEPQVSDLSHIKKHVIAGVGYCLQNIGRQGEAIPFYTRAIAIALDEEDWENASKCYLDLTILYAQLGDLTASADTARESLVLARRKQNKQFECDSLATQAWVTHLLGDLKTADALFQQAEALQRETDPGSHYLYSQRGIHHADHLRRIGEVDYARRVTEANFELWISYYKWSHDLSCYYRILGDLDADVGEHQSTQYHYNQALKIARSSSRWVLIEALLARGRWAARNREIEAARRYLDEALSYAVAGGYRVYEMDISIALARTHLAAGETASARAQAERAQHLSAEMSYYWGQVDAMEVLTALDGMV